MFRHPALILVMLAALFVGGIVWLFSEVSRSEREATQRHMRARAASSAQNEELGRDPLMDGTLQRSEPGLKQPDVLPAAEARSIGAQDEVVGVVADGHSRAYRLAVFPRLKSHVVNDVVAGVPLSIVYCNRNDQVRVFRGPEDGVANDLWLWGWMDRRLQLRWYQRRFAIDSTAAPLEDYPFERTDWETWKTAHPETEVFVEP